MTCENQCGTESCQSVPVLPACVGLSIVFGTDNSLEVSITDGDGKAIDITADTIVMTVKDQVGGAVQFAKSNGPGDHSAPELGQTVFEIEAADTATASATSSTYWVYEVRRVTAGGEERVHILGTFLVGPSV